ncbi:MAG: hypothetical protein M1828_003357 [Chrysothrix sp. TS-e1954]|nr:MAG: hypothetical protein M1828_003357 [Chrysothrix sp. TS-e1954]
MSDPDYGPSPYQGRVEKFRNVLDLTDKEIHAMRKLIATSHFDFSEPPLSDLKTVTETLEQGVLDIDAQFMALPLEVTDQYSTTFSRTSTGQYGANRSIEDALRFLKSVAAQMHAKFRGEFRTTSINYYPLIEAWVDSGLHDHESRLVGASKKFQRLLGMASQDFRENYFAAIRNFDRRGVVIAEGEMRLDPTGEFYVAEGTMSSSGQLHVKRFF